MHSWRNCQSLARPRPRRPYATSCLVFALGRRRNPVPRLVLNRRKGVRKGHFAYAEGAYWDVPSRTAVRSARTMTELAHPSLQCLAGAETAAGREPR